MCLVRIAALVAWVVCLPAVLAAQNPRLLRFTEPVRNLGRVKEVDGVVKLRYEFTNLSDKPVTLLDVHTQCGCLQPDYSRIPVAPGGKGAVDVTFDPKNRLGKFSIGLTVIATNGEYRKFNTLKAEGYVVSRIPEEQIYYPYVLSATFRADVGVVGMRQFEPGDGARTRRIRLFNTSDKPLELTYSSGSPHLAVSGPPQVGARSEAVVEFVLDPQNMEPGPFEIRSVAGTPGEEIPIEVMGVILEE